MSNHVKSFTYLAKNVKKYRKKLGITQEELAEITHISRSYIGYIESTTDHRSFSLEILFTLADALKIPAAALLDFSEYEEAAATKP